MYVSYVTAMQGQCVNVEGIYPNPVAYVLIGTVSKFTVYGIMSYSLINPIIDDPSNQPFECHESSIYIYVYIEDVLLLGLSLHKCL